MDRCFLLRTQNSKTPKSVNPNIPPIVPPAIAPACELRCDGVDDGELDGVVEVVVVVVVEELEEALVVEAAEVEVLEPTAVLSGPSSNRKKPKINSLAVLQVC